jgi:putative transposase
MTDYRRANYEGGYYFFTVVTYNRRRFLTEPLARHCLRAAWKEAEQRSNFEMIAVCLLPEHLHCIWKFPPGDCDFSLRWARIKAGFTRRYPAGGGLESVRSLSRDRKRERGLWQRRFWEHQIRDEMDLQRHVDYIHRNPVNHGLAIHIEDWPWSSYHRYARAGLYSNEYWQDAQSKLNDMSVYE